MLEIVPLLNVVFENASLLDSNFEISRPVIVLCASLLVDRIERFCENEPNKVLKEGSLVVIVSRETLPE